MIHPLVLCLTSKTGSYRLTKGIESIMAHIGMLTPKRTHMERSISQ